MLTNKYLGGYRIHGAVTLIVANLGDGKGKQAGLTWPLMNPWA